MGGGSEKGQICILSFVDDPWLMNLNTHTHTDLKFEKRREVPMFEAPMVALMVSEVGVFQVAEMPILSLLLQ